MDHFIVLAIIALVSFALGWVVPILLDWFVKYQEQLTEGHRRVDDD